MNDPGSRRFRDELEDKLGDLNVVLTTGQVEPGVDWAPTVRNRIKAAKIFVADLSGPSKEVLFELGFAGNKDLFPLVESNGHREQLPRWVTSKQCETFGDGRVAQVAEAIARRLTAKPGSAARPTPVPGLLAWVTGRDASWADEARNKTRLMCQEIGMEFAEHFENDLESPEDLQNVLRASIMVGVIDGGRQDYCVHFLLGDIVARTRAGAGTGRKQSVARRGYALLPNGTDPEGLLADSVRRISRRVVMQTTPERLRTDLGGAFDSYRNLLKDSYP